MASAQRFFHMLKTLGVFVQQDPPASWNANWDQYQKKKSKNKEKVGALGPVKACIFVNSGRLGGRTTRLRVHSSTASDRCWIGAERLLIINVEGGSQRNLVHIEEVNSMCEIQWTSRLHVWGGTLHTSWIFLRKNTLITKLGVPS